MNVDVAIVVTRASFRNGQMVVEFTVSCSNGTTLSTGVTLDKTSSAAVINNSLDTQARAIIAPLQVGAQNVLRIFAGATA